MWSQENVLHAVVDSIEILDYLNETNKITISNQNSNQSSLLASIDNQSFATLRSGGPSVLATMLHRGMASRHTAILWNGFNIQSIVNGTFDLGLVSNTFDQTKFYKNGTSAVSGNASIAGALALENEVLKTGGTSINLSISSAQNKDLTLINKYRHKQYYHHFGFNLKSNDNQYSYKSNGIKLTQNSAAFSMWDINYKGHIIISDKLSMSGGGWLQNANRHIPATKTSVNIKQEQEDANYRGFLQLAFYVSDDTRLKLRTAYFDETIEYSAPGIFSNANADVINIAIDFTYKSNLNLSAQYRKDMVKASFFEPVHDRNTVALLADWKIKFNLFEVGASLRPEWVDNRQQPFILGFRLKREWSEAITTSFRYNKGYTLPSFNDLYWPAGGNPDLRTEKSHEFDFGINYLLGEENNEFVQLNIFFNLIDDWIQWTPIDGFFQPINQRKVRNLGLELKLSHDYKWKADSHFQFRVLYAFTDSRLLKHYLNPDNEGKRSIFVPVHKITGQISLIKKSWQIHLKPLYYSKRYDTVDNSTFVSGFLLLDLEAVKKINLKQFDLLISIGIENGLNNDYENIKFYPMPLRVFRLAATFKL